MVVTQIVQKVTQPVPFSDGFTLYFTRRGDTVLARAQLLRISKQSIADLVAGASADDIAAGDTPADHGLNDGDVPRLKDRLTVRVRNGLSANEQAQFKEQDYRNELQFDSSKTVSEITDDSQRGQAAALA